MERCYFVDFPFFNTYFEHELDFSWARHEARLAAHGHNASDPANAPMATPFGYTTIADWWMFNDVKERTAKSYGVEMVRDLDYSAALIQSNPYHRVRAPCTAMHLCVLGREAWPLHSAPCKAMVSQTANRFP